MKRTVVAATLAGLLVGAIVAAPASVAASNSGCQGYIGITGTLGMPAGSWDVGEHSYSITFSWLEPYGPDSFTTDPVTFTVSPAAPLLRGPVFLRGGGLSATPGPPTPVGDTINPAQPTVFWAGYIFWPGDYSTVPEVLGWLRGTTISYAWDGQDPVPANLSPASNSCAIGGAVTPDGTWHIMGQVHRHYAP